MTLFGMGDPRPIHFMGIGGAGMSGLALLAKRQGLAVTGCDNDPSGAADLAALGVEIWRGGAAPARGGGAGGGGAAGAGRRGPQRRRARPPLAPTVAVVNNVEADHLECYGTLAALESAFAEFAGRARQVIVGGDDAGAQRVAASLGVPVWRVGFGEDADVRILGVTLGAEGSEARVRLPDGAEVSLRLRVPGIHNVRNASMALAVAHALHADHTRVLGALQQFSGVARRFERIGEAGGGTGGGDYAAHPPQVAAALAAARPVVPPRSARA